MKRESMKGERRYLHSVPGNTTNRINVDEVVVFGSIQRLQETYNLSEGSSVHSQSESYAHFLFRSVYRVHSHALFLVAIDYGG